MKRLCFGGSFNPIHHGHLICARVAAEKMGFDRVMLIPSARPPHKPQTAELASSRDRAEMCRLAAESDPMFEMEPIELDRTGPSYTIDTARQLAARPGWGPRISWLIGADMLAILPQWHEPQALLREVDIVIMARPGWAFDWERLPAEYKRLRDCVVETPLIDISATDLRRRVREGRSIKFLTPKSVVKHIDAHSLYRP